MQISNYLKKDGRGQQELTPDLNTIKQDNNMSLLQNIKRGVQQRPQRVIIYGPEGVGKSTLAAGLPAPVLLDTEQGSSHIDVARLDCRSYGDVINAIEELTQGGHEFRTVIIDSIDWCERLFVNAFIREHNKRANASLKSIEDFGYGKGYKMIEPVAMDLLSRLNALMSAGMNVVLVGHSRRVKFEMPETAGAYDKHELNLSKFVAPLVKEWADAMLFCNFVVTVQDGKGHKGQKARSGAPRPGFEGGQMPLYRRLPKRGFKNRNTLTIVPINLSALERFDNDAVVSVETLIEAGIVKNPRDGVKILGNGELTKKLTVQANAFSASAKEKIEALGGKAEVI